jgi:tellurite resistance protein
MESFFKTVNSEIYVDKTGLIKYTNKVINTQQGYLCISRPRRFGKSIAANMLAAYYSCECDSKELFRRFEIAKSSDFEKYLNQYDTIFLNMQEFLSQSSTMEEMISLVRKSVLWELLGKYPDYRIKISCRI